MTTAGPEDSGDLAALLRKASEDALALIERLKTQDTQLERRALVRAVFSFVEGMTFALKQEALNRNAVFSPAEIALLREQSYEINDKGKAIVRPALIELRRNIRFAFDCFARGWHTSNRLDLSEDGWRCLQEALFVRHRLMHPKGLSDFHVSDSELDATTKGFFWFHCQFAITLAGALGSWYRAVKAADAADHGRNGEK